MTNMHRLILSFLVLTHVGQVLTFDIKCFQMTPFDGYCQLISSTNVIFVTTQPCKLTKPTVAIVLVENGKVIRKDITEKKNYMLHLNDTKIVTFDQSLNDGLNDIHKVKLEMSRKDFKKTMIFEMTINSNDCYKRKNANSVVPPTAESGQHQLGEFSTLFIPPSRSNAPLSIPLHTYAIYFNPCTVPFSYIVKIFTKNHGTVLHQYTDTMNQSFIKIPGDTKGGLQLFTQTSISPEYHTVTIFYAEKTSTRRQRLVNQLWSSHLGLICSIQPCKSGEDKLFQQCHSPWIDYQNKLRTARMNITFHLCFEPNVADIVIDMMDDEELIFKEPKRLKAISEKNWGNKKYTLPLQLGYAAYERADTPWDGFLPLDGGRISLFVVRRQTGRKGFHVLILRHYPTAKTATPIFNTFFESVKCKRKANNERAIIIGLVCALVGFLVLLVFVCYARRKVILNRRNGKHKKIGLPHQIQLEDDDFSYQDDL